VTFRELLEHRRKEYKGYSRAFCPVLEEYAEFNADGFVHLRFHVDGTPRSPKEQMYKLGLLPLVRPVIYLASAAKYEKRFTAIGRNRKGKKKEVRYWGLEAVVGRKQVRVKVVLRKIGAGKLHFWSVMKLDR